MMGDAVSLRTRKGHELSRDADSQAAMQSQAMATETATRPRMPAPPRTRVLFITDFQGLIPQRIQAWDGYDLDRIKALLEAAGAEVRIVGAHELDFRVLEDEKPVAALYASSQAPRYKQYLQDIVAHLHFAGVLLFPSLAHMLAHEDKAFQAMTLAATDINAPRSYIFGNTRQAYAFLESASFPLVGKSAHGYGSQGVRLLDNARAARQFVDEQMVHRALKKGRPLALRILQRIVRPKPVLGLLLFQELIPNLQGDWKILIWGDTACGLYRRNRPGDFRASGSGSFAFAEIPTPVLDFARDVLEKLDLPWASLDIGYDGHTCHLFEYQGIHFGLRTAEMGQFYYTRDAQGTWTKQTGRIQIEAEMARIMIDALTQHGVLPD